VVVSVAVPAIARVLLAMVYDWRTRGRPHKVYVFGALLNVIEPVLVVPISGTQAWLSTAKFLEHLAG
jgi:hypothetical protein